MHLRRSHPDDDRPIHDPYGAPAGPDGYEESDIPSRPWPVAGASVEPVTFRVPAGVIVGKFAVAAVLALATLLADNRSQVTIGLVAAVAVAVYALRDVIARNRLTAGPDGLVASRGYTGRRRLEWSQVERITVDRRPRFGLRSEFLELDSGDEIFLFSQLDLGVPPAAARLALERVRPPESTTC